MNSLSMKTIASLFVVTNLLGSIYSHPWDVQLNCSAPWVQCEFVTLYCDIKKSSFPSKCQHSVNDTSIYQISSDALARNRSCVIRNFQYLCDHSPPTIGCSCIQDVGDRYRLQYQFKAQMEYQGSWTCTPYCFSSEAHIYSLQNNDIDCQNKVVLPAETKAKLSFQCPLIWYKYDVISVVCKISKSNCDVRIKSVVFKSVDNNLLTTEQCVVYDFSCTFTPDSLGCGCVRERGGNFTFQFNFHADDTYKGNWVCEPNWYNMSLITPSNIEDNTCMNKEIEWPRWLYVLVAMDLTSAVIDIPILVFAYWLVRIKWGSLKWRLSAVLTDMKSRPLTVGKQLNCINWCVNILLILITFIIVCITSSVSHLNPLGPNISSSLLIILNLLCIAINTFGTMMLSQNENVSESSVPTISHSKETHFLHGDGKVVNPFSQVGDNSLIKGVPPQLHGSIEGPVSAPDGDRVAMQTPLRVSTRAPASNRHHGRRLPCPISEPSIGRTTVSAYKKNRDRVSRSDRGLTKGIP